MWYKSKKPFKIVIIIKQADIAYIVRSSFFRQRWKRQADHNCRRSGHDTLIQKAALAFVSAPADVAVSIPLQCADQPFVVADVMRVGNETIFDLHVYVIHVDSVHQITRNDHCVLLADHPLDELLRKRVMASVPDKEAKAA